MKIVNRVWGWGMAAAFLLAPGPADAQHGHDEATAHPAPAVGDVVSGFDAQSVDGSMQKVAFNGRGSTVLLFFLSSCPTCHRMIPEWNRAFQRKPAGLQVYGVILDKEPPTFFQSYPMAFPVVRSPGREFQQKIKVSRTPTMLRVGPGGKVEDVVVGYTDPIRVGEIFRP
jgi:hypothetical protein